MNLAEVYRGKRVLVTGNTGFKGSWLCAWLLEMGAEVSGFAIDIPTTPALFEVLGLSGRMDHTFGDIIDAAAVDAVLERARPDVVFHLAAQPLVRLSYADPTRTFATNVMGTVTLLDAIRRRAAHTSVVNVTSDKCYENREWPYPYREIDAMGGSDPYSASKGCAELVFASYYRSFLQKGGITAVSMRAGNVIGGGDFAQDRLIPDCARAWGEGQAVQLRNPAAVRPWQHVLEPLRGYLLAGAQLLQGDPAPPLSGEAFNLGPDADAFCSVGEVVGEFQKHWPAARAQVIAEAEQKAQVHEARTLKLACEKARESLGYRPILGFREGIEWTALWYRAFAAGAEDMNAFTLGQLRSYQSRLSN